MPLLHLVKVGHEFNLTISSAEKVLKETRTPELALRALEIKPLLAKIKT